MKSSAQNRGQAESLRITELATCFLEALGIHKGTADFFQGALGSDWTRLVAEAERHLSRHGDLERHCQAFLKIGISENRETKNFGPIPTTCNFDGSPITTEIRDAFLSLKPWRKGPFVVDGMEIDAEWRCQLKWQRVLDIARPFSGGRILDVGSGNGYYLYRAHEAHAAFVLGLEPSVHYCAQFATLQRLFRCPAIAILPLTSEEFTAACRAFDTVLSMGVLYHRRSPLDHLGELRDFLRPGGELILETLVVEGGEGYSLVPPARYAQMRNVWFLPSIPTLKSWLRKLGFYDIREGALVQTTHEEQRATSWSSELSLKDFLDPSNPQLTKEGHPAPVRVILRATAP